MKIGDRSRCMQCGGKIVLAKHPGIISLSLAVWRHSGPIRSLFPTHRAVGPLS